MKTTSTDLGTLGRFALGRRLVRVTTALSILLVALIANLTVIQFVQARELANHPANTRNLAEQARQDRGSILTRDGVVLAESVPAGRSVFRRTYPQGRLASHTVGYYSIRYGRAGVESAANDALAGERMYRDWGDVIDSAVGRPVKGSDVVLTLDSRIQRAAEKTLGKRRGAVVVLDPRSGAVLASASNPGYDPSEVEDRWESLSAAANAPLLDRGRQSLRAPGSTFKLVTLTAALGSGTAKPSSTYPGPGRLEIGGAPVTNFEGGSYGRINLAEATQRSINTVFAQVAVELGADALVAQARRFGFGEPVGYELPSRTALMPDPDEMTTWETAWAGVGQPVGEHESPPGPQATVLQMALVAAGIGNGGVVMRPFVIDEVRNEAGVSGGRTSPRPLSTATDAKTASTVTKIMVDTVERGSGVRARVSGVEVAGKTGTAESGKAAPNDAWFVAFAPAENPTVALAILIEEGGVGGRVAAPAAKSVLEAALEAQGAGR